MIVLQLENELSGQPREAWVLTSLLRIARSQSAAMFPRGLVQGSYRSRTGLVQGSYIRDLYEMYETCTRCTKPVRDVRSYRFRTFKIKFCTIVQVSYRFYSLKK